jgi:hypothetical protein
MARSQALEQALNQHHTFNSYHHVQEGIVEDHASDFGLNINR